MTEKVDDNGNEVLRAAAELNEIDDKLDLRVIVPGSVDVNSTDTDKKQFIDNQILCTLENVLEQLKIMNLHLSEVTNNEITEL